MDLARAAGRGIAFAAVLFEEANQQGGLSEVVLAQGVVALRRAVLLARCGIWLARQTHQPTRWRR